jgi:hypothetical protein
LTQCNCCGDALHRSLGIAADVSAIPAATLANDLADQAAARQT